MKEFDFSKENCECCQKIKSSDKDSRIWFWGVYYYNDKEYDSHYVSSIYCPMCGRRLTDD